MNRNIYLGVTLIVVLALAGCAQNKTRVAEGAGIGGVLGGAVGTILGYQSGHPMQGLAIGAAAGAAGGGLIGAQIKKPQPQEGTDAGTPAASAPLNMQDVINMAKEKVSDADIVSKIQATNSKFYLMTSDLDYLHNQGVSQRVVDAMQATTKPATTK